MVVVKQQRGRILSTGQRIGEREDNIRGELWTRGHSIVSRQTNSNWNPLEATADRFVEKVTDWLIFQVHGGLRTGFMNFSCFSHRLDPLYMLAFRFSRVLYSIPLRCKWASRSINVRYWREKGTSSACSGWRESLQVVARGRRRRLGGPRTPAVQIIRRGSG